MGSLFGAIVSRWQMPFSELAPGPDSSAQTGFSPPSRPPSPAQVAPTTENAIPEEKLRLWEVLREVVVHEDDLVNHRLTWLFAIQAFIVGGFFVVQGELLKSKLPALPTTVAEGILIGACACAAYISVTTSKTIGAAYDHISVARCVWVRRHKTEAWPVMDRELARIKLEWDKQFPIKPEPQLPNLAGLYTHSTYRTHYIPKALLTLDLVLLATCIGMIYAVNFQQDLIYSSDGKEIHLHLGKQPVQIAPLLKK